jgi:GTP cyclohydrolase III
VKLRVVFGTVLLVVIVNVLAVPTTKVALFTLVMRGGRVMVRVKFCVAAGETPLDAVNVRA